MSSKIKISAAVQAPIEKVWECWTLPEHITSWNFASDDWHSPRSVNNLKVGGTFNNRMEAKDGSFGFDFEGTYTEVIPLTRISYILEDNREVTTDFKTKGNTTEIVTLFDAETENPPEMQQQGWQAILNNFKKHVESL